MLALSFQFLPVSVCTHKMLAIMLSSLPIIDEKYRPREGSSFSYVTRLVNLNKAEVCPPNSQLYARELSITFL